MPCSYYMHHDLGSESDESSQITVVTDNNGIWADGFLTIWKCSGSSISSLKPPDWSSRPETESERLFRAEDEIGPGRDIWKALSSLTHTMVVGMKSSSLGTLMTQAIWDPLKKKKWLGVDSHWKVLGMVWKEWGTGSLWKVQCLLGSNDYENASLVFHPPHD